MSPPDVRAPGNRLQSARAHKRSTSSAIVGQVGASVQVVARSNWLDDCDPAANPRVVDGRYINLCGGDSRDPLSSMTVIERNGGTDITCLSDEEAVELFLAWLHWARAEQDVYLRRKQMRAEGAVR